MLHSMLIPDNIDNELKGTKMSSNDDTKVYCFPNLRNDLWHDQALNRKVKSYQGQRSTHLCKNLQSLQTDK